MSTTPLKLDILLGDQDARPRDWQPRKNIHKGPLRLVRLCVLGAFLPAALVAGPIYLRYRVYSEQLYPLAASDQRLIDRRVSTTWCQRHLVKVNATFNAYLLKEAPKIEQETKSISMTRHLVLEDDMKEYWGFYLLRGSSVTVSTCVRWPGASLTMIRGHKHLHECAFIGDDSSEELEELVEVARERGLIPKTTDDDTLPDFHLRLPKQKDSGPSNLPERMKTAREEIRFHEKSNAPRYPNGTLIELSSLLSRSRVSPGYGSNSESHELDAKAMRQILTSLFVKTFETKKKQKENPHHHYEGVFKESSNIDKPPFGSSLFHSTVGSAVVLNNSNASTPKPTTNVPSLLDLQPLNERNKTNALKRQQSAEIFEDVLRKLNALGERGKRVLQRLVDETMDRQDAEAQHLKGMLNNVMANDTLSESEKKRLKRQLVLGSPLYNTLGKDAGPAEDAAIEKEEPEDLYPDGIAEDRGTVNETTLNDRSNSEFWSSFSSSEERLLECKGLILNLPLTPHIRCSPKYEHEHTSASVPNTVTYRVPIDGYYFFVFNSENEIQPNYVRIRFDLIKTVYDTSNPVDACKNSTEECALPLNFFSHQRTVLELPVNGNDSQWNEEYVVVSTCEPRTSIYLICIITVPLLILLFAFH